MAKYTNKNAAKAENQVDSVEAVEVSEKVVTKAETKSVPKKKVFEPSDMIPCRSVCQGALYLEGPRTKMPYEWTDYGAIEEVEYRDLAELVHRICICRTSSRIEKR